MAVDLPRLETDKPYTYLLPIEPTPGLFVSVPFHGRTVKGYVLGPTDDVPGRVLPVRRVLSSVPLFAAGDLELYRWMADRYVIPLATVIGRAHPPRVAGEEGRPAPDPEPLPARAPPDVLAGYRHGEALRAACRSGSGAFVFRPLPDHEAGACLEAVDACVAGGRRAIVVVPEAEPLPETARAVKEAYGEAALLYVGGGQRARYRWWLDMLAGRWPVVVGTQRAVLAPVADLGLVWVNREAHPALREDRAPRHHARDVALARAGLSGAVAVLAGLCPSAEAVALAGRGGAVTIRAPRQAERRAAPLVETVRPDREEIAHRLASRLRETDGAFLLVSRRGAGVARVCRTCGAPARCATCGGTLQASGGRTRCTVCGAEGACASCGGTSFGIDPRGVEHVEARARRLTDLPVRRVDEGPAAEPPGPGRVVVGTAAAVKDFGPLRVGLVSVLDADAARRRPGFSAPEQSLATWMEAAMWAGPRGSGGRVVVQTAEPADPAIQALIRWDPLHLHRHEAARRAEAGFPPGHPVFRLVGPAGLPNAVKDLDPVHVLATSLGDETVCLVTLRPDAVSGLREWVRTHPGVVARVEAEPQL